MHAKILYCGQDLHFLREQRQYEIEKDAKLLVSSEEWKNIELDLIRKADCSLYPSYVEEAFLKEIDPAFRVETYPVYIMEKSSPKPYDFTERKDILFVGGFKHPPNADAIHWFAGDIYPRILEKYPDMVFHIVGSSVPEEIEKLDGKNIRVHGFVSDEALRQLYDQVRLVVVPLRYGAGIKGKVVEAMSLGVPVVTTSIGAEGFRNPAPYLAVQDDADLFADCVNNLYDDMTALTTLVKNAYDYLSSEFSKEKARSVFESALRYHAEKNQVDEVKKCI